MNIRTSLIINASTKERFHGLSVQLCPAQCRFETLEDRQYTAVPMVMITEGVHTGNGGAIYYPGEELAKIPEIWNHKPVVVYHPERNGEGISACDPVVLNNRKVGLIMKTAFDKTRLRSEAWVDMERAKVVDERVAVAIANGEMMELSTGLYMDIEDVQGEWKGEPYIGIARNFRPDHLALLPDKIGACSIADGAGFIRNQKDDKEGHWKGLKDLMRKAGFLKNEMSQGNISSIISDLIRKQYNFTPDNGPWIWVCDVYSNFFVYELDGKLFRLGYSASDEGVSLSGDKPKEVRRVTEYRTVDGAFVGNGDQPVNNMDKTSMVSAIIANKDSGWSETDRPALLAMNDAQIKALHKGLTTNAAPAPAPAAPAVTAPAAPAVPATPVVNAAPAPLPPALPVAPAVVAPQTAEQYIANAPAPIRELLHNGLQVHNEEKVRLIDTITANANNVYTKDELANYPLGELRKIARLCGIQAVPSAQTGFANYGGMAPAPIGNVGAEEPMGLPVLDYSKK